MKQIAAALLISLSAVVGYAQERPNFVWILSEDNSKHYLKHFDPAGTPTPNIERLAAGGVTFDHAFSCSPVCSVARTTLMTTAYAPKLGTQYHRKLAVARLPQDLQLFPAYLKSSGYYTTNNSKKDYNCTEGDVWHASSKKASWRNRPDKAMPFFHMASYGTSHESSLHFNDQSMRTTPVSTDPQSISLAPYHPDTSTFRYTHARYLDRIKMIDKIVGDVTKALQDDGVLEDTFIFYFGDHGGVLPRGKGYAYESGLHVPLVVRIPEKWRHLTDRKMGDRAPGFVSFVDFGATVLHLAGLKIPKLSDGQPFFGKDIQAADVDARDEAFGYADRFDEKYELVRTLRKGKFKYMRNFQCFYPDGLQNNYRYRMLAYQEWRRLYQSGDLNAEQRQFYEAKQPEALYDLEKDPHEVHNLAKDPEYQSVLRDLRRRLATRMESLPDLSLFPESVMIEQALDSPVKFGQQRKQEIRRLLEIANLCLEPQEEASKQLKRVLQTGNPLEKYWALTACSCLGKEAASLAKDAKPLLQDDDLLVRVRAAEFLAILGQFDPRPTIMEVLNVSKSAAVNLITLNSVVYLRDGGPGVKFNIASSDITAQNGEVKRRIEYLSSKPLNKKTTPRKKRPGR